MFFLDTYEKHTLHAMNILCRCTGLQRVVSPVGTNFEDRVQKTIGCDHTEGPVSLSSISNASCALAFVAEKVESDATRLEVTPLEAPWRNGKTERAGKDRKEDNHNMTQDGTEAQTWTDFEEDCDAVNQVRASKINDSGHSAYQRVFGRTPPQMEDAILACGGADLVVVSRQQAGELTQERSMTMRRLALQASLALDHRRRWKRALHHAAKHYQGEPHVSQFLWFWRRGASPTNKCFLASRRCHQQHVGHSLFAYRGSVVKCARSQVRPFHEDDEAAHEHVTEHKEKLGRTTTTRRRLTARRHHWR